MTLGLPGERGFSVVEVVIAMLLLAVVAAGVSMAFVGSTKLQGAAKANASLHAAAERVFEHLRADRSWMEPCKSSYAAWCDVSSMAGLSPTADVLKDSSLGTSICPGHPGDYRHNLAAASVMAIDSPGDGKGAADKDGLLPDYYRVYVKVDTWCAQDRKRLHASQPAVVDATIDPRGKVPNGTVLVEVCRVVNQVDDRMSISGCPSGGASDTKEMPCPPAHPSYNGTPAAYCGAAWSWIASNAPSPSLPAPYVNFRRDTATFTLDNGVGDQYSSGAGGVYQGNGTYLFKNIPAGTYAVTGLTPSSGALELWETKVIPSLDNDGIVRLTVQPDVRNQALIPMRPKANHQLLIRFKRRVGRHQLHKVVGEGPHTVGTDIPTDAFEADPNKIRDMYLMLCSALCSGSQGSNWDFFGPTPNGNCINNRMVSREKIQNDTDGDGYTEDYWNGDGHGPTFDDVDDFHWSPWVDSSSYNGDTCTVYDLYVWFDYYYTSDMGAVTFRGAPFSTGYSTTPAPTFRDTEKVPTAVPSFPWCAGPNSLTSAVTRVPRLAWNCINQYRNYGDAPIGEGSDRVTLKGLSTGLWTGIAADGHGTSGSSDSTWNPARNESVIGFNPPQMRAPAGAMWVNPNGSITTPGGAVPGGTSPNVTVTGQGECWWFQTDGSKYEGSCNPCNPFIEPLSGTFPGCFILTKVSWFKCVRVIGAGAAFYSKVWGDCNSIASGTEDQVQVCSSAPQTGSPGMTAPNCHTAPTGGARDDVDQTTHVLTGGSGSIGTVSAPHTDVGSS